VNVTIAISTDLVPPDKVESINRYVLHRGSLLQTHVIFQHLGISREKALALLQLIAVKVGGQKVFLIYHDSCPDAAGSFVEERPVRDGLPSFPYTCPVCERIITNADALSYDVALRLPAGTEVRIESLHV
jgi:hypothetical protein